MEISLCYGAEGASKRGVEGSAKIHVSPASGLASDLDSIRGNTP